MKAKRWFTTAASLVLAGSLIAGCTTTGGKTETSTSGNEQGSATTQGNKKAAVVNTYINGEIPTIDPNIAKDSYSSWVIDHTFEGLFVNDKDGVKPGQAKEVQVSEDGLTYTFTLKDGLKWSNGDPVTAADFEFSWKRVLDPATAAEYAYQIADYVKGAKEYNSADPKKLSADEIKKLRDAVGVQAKDDKTLVVTLKAPTPYFKQLTAFYTYYPVPKKVVEANPNWAADASTYVGNGPFKLQEWQKDKVITVVKNDNYYNKSTITTDKIVWNNITDDNTAWQMFQNGELNYIKSVPPAGIDAAKASGELKISPQLATYFYRFNTTKPPFNNVKIRKALAMAIDRQAIIDTITKGGQKPAFAIVGPGIAAQDGKNKEFRDETPAYFKEDIAEAQKLLKEGLAELGMTSMPKVTITFNTNAGHQKIAQAIQEMWKKNLGFESTIENVESKVWLARQSALDFQIMRAGWVGDYLDPMTYIDMWVTGGTNNNTGYSNPEYDKLVAASKVEKDMAKRDQILHDAEKILINDMPFMPIYFYTNADASKKELEGIYVPANRYPQFRYVTVK
ncbi:peptide ABC transporter substrate-binding protein [Paenibacillus chartarius]|uniref:Peptide ABC transporter substrate-binding protein n=1 Tax=Paenibacillus chartarius TaxID=747481 RepID=A0ABV6DUI0_9BACL